MKGTAFVPSAIYRILPVAYLPGASGGSGPSPLAAYCARDGSIHSPANFAVHALPPLQPIASHPAVSATATSLADEFVK